MSTRTPTAAPGLLTRLRQEWDHHYAALPHELSDRGEFTCGEIAAQLRAAAVDEADAILHQLLVSAHAGDKVAERNAAAPAVRADNSSYYAKKTSRKEAVTGGSDLISDISNGDIALEAVPEADLNAEMQGMSAPEREAYVQETLKARKTLETEMAELVTKRDAYIAEQQAATGGADSFDASVKHLLKDQLS